MVVTLAILNYGTQNYKYVDKNGQPYTQSVHKN